MNANRQHKIYLVQNAGPGKYTAEYGDVCTNFWCGCFAQHYAFDIIVNNDSVVVLSTVPCSGLLGGVVGMHKNDDESNAVRRRLQAAFPGRTVY